MAAEMTTTTATTLERMQALRPMIRDRSAEIEALGTLPADLDEALTATGYLRMAVPKAFGGDELTLNEMHHVIAEAACADSSVGWLVMIASHMAWFHSKLPAATFAAIYADGPDVRSRFSGAPKGIATRVDDGYVVSGQWPFASGAPNPQYLGASCIVMDSGAPVITPEGAPDIIAVMLRSDQVEMLDTWEVMGLRGTNSCDFAVAEAFVPEAWSLRLTNPSSLDNGYGRLGMKGVLTGNASVGIGIARAAQDELIELAPTKGSTFDPTTKLAQDPGFRNALGELTMRIDAAESFVHDQVRRLWDAAVAGEAIDEIDGARLAAVSTHCTAMCVEAVDRAYSLAGSASLYASSGLQRRLRDIHTATQHVAASQGAYSRYGVALMRAEQAPSDQMMLDV